MECPHIDNTYKTCETALTYAAIGCNIEIVKLLLEDLGTEIDEKYNYILRAISKDIHVEILQLMLKNTEIDPSYMNNYSLRYAIERGYIKIVKLLLRDSRINPSFDSISKSIGVASINGHREVVKILFESMPMHESPRH